jgi:hypothetical protein
MESFISAKRRLDAIHYHRACIKKIFIAAAKQTIDGGSGAPTGHRIIVSFIVRTQLFSAKKSN